jgi:signal transduction histidine kinase
MTSIQGYLQAMIDGVVKMGDPKYIRMILEKTRIVNRLTRELLDLSKLEAQQVVFSFKPVGEAEFIHLFTDYEAEVQAQGLRFVVNPVENMPDNRTFSVQADKFRIGQVIGNMVSNALKFTPPGGSLAVTMEMSVSGTGAGNSGTLKVRLTDTGAGIDEQSLPFLFDRFYKGTGKAKEGMEGSGLGLAIAKEIILQHGGTIGVDSIQDEGSAFYFTLPAELLPLEE